jgi:hypothetical protein
MNNLAIMNLLAVIPAKAASPQPLSKRDGRNLLRKRFPTLHFRRECSREKLSSQNGNSKIFEKK